MFDKTAVGLMLIGLVLLLTFRDLVVLEKQGEQETSKSVKKNPSGQIDLNFENENNQQTNDFIENKSESDDTGFSADQSEDVDDQGFTHSSYHPEKTIPSLKIKGNQQTLKFQFCYSCGYRNMFEQYSQLIQSKYPELKIVGENYTPNKMKVYIAQFLSTFKMILIVCVMFGQNPFPYLHMQTPQVFIWATENKFYACLMIFFISNAIETQLITSGAFEIYLNDMQIWSKLQSERIPHEKELLQIIDMNFNFEPDKNKKW